MLFAAAVLAWLAFARAADAAPGYLTTAPYEHPAPGTGAGVFGDGFSLGVAVDPNLPGNVYTNDRPNDRINVFSPWGEFVMSFGWGVNVSAPAEALQVCTAATGCRQGTKGAGSGQLDQPEAIANDAAGDLYVLESGNLRVQKFDADGNFILMFGDGVNATTGGDVCTAISGDTCQAGTAGEGPGQLSGGLYLNRLAVSPGDGSVFVAEKDRIQKFTASGSYLETIAMPAGKNVNALAADASRLYVTFSGPGESNLVHTLEPSGPAATFLEPTFTLASDASFVAMAPNPAGGLYALTASSAFSGAPDRAVEFDPSGTVVSTFDLSTDGTRLKGIDTGSACGSTDVYVTHYGNGSAGPVTSYVNVFGPAPNLATCPQPAAPPTITDSFVSSVGTEEAELEAEINPNFWPDTNYYVEYGIAPCSGGGCDEEQPAAPGANLTSEVVRSPLDVSIALDNLAPDTTYHYRFVAQSSGGGPVRGIGGVVGIDGTEGTFHTYVEPDPPNASCPNQAFRSFTPSAPLPDCRAYEMVSPLIKGGLDLKAPFTPACGGCQARIDQATAGGSKITYSSFSSFGEEAGGALFSSQYLAERGPGGWQTTNISPHSASISFYLYSLEFDLAFHAFSPDLCRAYYLQMADIALTPGDQPGFPDVYRIDTCQNPLAYSLITSAAPLNPQPPADAFNTYYPRVQGFSADGSLAVLRANAKLTPNASSAGGGARGPVAQLYLKEDKGLRLVSVMPDGSAAGVDSSVGNQGGRFRSDTLARAISADGTKVFFTSPDQEAPVGSGLTKLYVRINANQGQSKLSAGKCSEPAKACTLAISESIGSSSQARFWTATADGSKVLFDFNPFGGGVDAGDLYSYDVATQTPTLIAPGVQGLLGASDDLSKIYLVSTAVLDSDSGGVAGKNNVYLYEEGEGFTYVATLASDDFSLGVFDVIPNRGENRHTSRVSPDGSHVAFMSRAPLTGYDNTDAASDFPDAEVFLYEAADDELLCVSCNPSGARPAGVQVQSPINNSPATAKWGAAKIPAAEYSLHFSRSLSEDGDRLFFESFDRLLPADTSVAKDVYQWEALESGDCDEGDANYFETNGGCLSLISTGESPREAEFLDASADGTDVFFGSAERLHGSDTDSLIDIYDARAGGGFPEPPPAPVPCDLSAGACEGAGSTPPNNTGAGSAVFQGQGNPAPAKPCPKGKRRVTRKGNARCVSKQHKHHKRAANRTRRVG